MQMPKIQEVRTEIEKAIQSGLAATNGSWMATMPGGKEISFRPNENGEIYITVSDDEEMVENHYKFVVKVEIAADQPPVCTCSECKGKPDHIHNRISTWPPE